MKKLKFTLVFALVALCSCLQANADLRFGVKAGLNVDKLHLNKEIFDGDNRCGWTAGVMTEFTVPVVGVGMDLSVMYTRMNSVSPVVEANSKNFLEIPLNLKYKVNIPAVNQLIRPLVYTGPTLALKLGSNDDNFLTTKTAQWGWNLGVGVELIKHLQICGGYTFGINNVIKTFNNFGADLGVDNNVKIKNNYWTVTAAWLF